jgi:hypothetical protein
MARLTMAQRKRIPKGKFAEPSKAPGRGSFPIEDKAHVQAAKRFERFASPSAKKKIDAAAKRMGVGKKPS